MTPMEISVQSSELIEALSAKITNLVVELETTRIALSKAQEAITVLEQEALPRASVMTDHAVEEPAVPVATLYP